MLWIQNGQKGRGDAEQMVDHSSSSAAMTEHGTDKLEQASKSGPDSGMCRKLALNQLGGSMKRGENSKKFISYALKVLKW